MNNLQIMPCMTSSSYQTNQTVTGCNTAKSDNVRPTSFKGRKINIFLAGLMAFGIGYSSLFEYHHAQNFFNVSCLGGGLFTMILTTLVGIFGKKS